MSYDINSNRVGVKSLTHPYPFITWDAACLALKRMISVNFVQAHTSLNQLTDTRKKVDLEEAFNAVCLSVDKMEPESNFTVKFLAREYTLVKNGR